MPDAREYIAPGLIEACPKANPSFRMVMSRKDFNPDIHQLYVPGTAPAPETSAPPRARLAPKPEPTTFGSQTKDQLLTMTIESLKKLPEFAHIDAPVTKKSDIVDQILAVREAAKPKE